MTDPRDDAPGERIAEAASATTLRSSQLLRLVQHDSAEWNDLVNRFQDSVFRHCRRKLRSREDAEDVTQNVFLTLACSITLFAYRKPGDSFRAWLWMVTECRIADFQRRQKSRPKLVTGGSSLHDRLEQEPDSAAQSSQASELALTPAQLVALEKAEEVESQVQPNTWAAFYQVEIEGRAIADVAAELRMTTNHVSVAKSRVRAALREISAGLLD